MTLNQFFYRIKILYSFFSTFINFEENLNLNLKRNIIINDIIFYFYLVLNILSFIIGYGVFSPGIAMP